jgi:UDP-glucose 4-epimerase
MIRVARRPQLPLASPAFGPVTSAARRVGMAPLSEDFRRLLRYGRGVDTTRLVREIGFTPGFTTEGAVHDWAGVRAGTFVRPPERAAA